MTPYTNYDPMTGIILGTGVATDETLDAMIRFGATALLDVQADAATQYVDLTGDGPQLSEYTAGERAALAALAPGWLWQMPERVAVDRRTIDATRAAKIAAMSEACASTILAGFTSAALGATHAYPAKQTDQANLAGSIIASLIAGPGDWATPFWCADASGNWEFRMHTAAEIQQVGRDGKGAILAAMTRNEMLRAQIEVSTIEEIDAIRWTE